MLSNVSVLQASAGGLLALVVLMVLTGRLVSRRVLEDVRRDRDVRVAEARALAEVWRQAWETERAVRERAEGHAQLAIETARTATAVIGVLPVAAAEGEPDANAVA